MMASGVDDKKNELLATGSSSGVDASTRAPSTAQKLIKVENQQHSETQPSSGHLQRGPTMTSSQQEARA